LHIIEEIAGGCTIGELIDAYPILTREAIQAALKFAAESFTVITPGQIRIRRGAN
jgi:uncharacterized protein (DUF433 family)